MQVVCSKNKWFYLNLNEINRIVNKSEKNYYLIARKNFLKQVVLPLTLNLPLHSGFKFSDMNDNLSCNSMLIQLFNEYHKRNYTKEEIKNIISGKRVKKR